MTKRKMLSIAQKLASISAAGASAIALSGGKAQAETIISNVLNVTIGFTNDSNNYGRQTVASHMFSSLAGGPALSFRAVSSTNERRSERRNGSTTSQGFARFIEANGAGFARATNGVARFSAGKAYTAGMAMGSGFNVGKRSWSSVRRYSRNTRTSSTGNGLIFHTTTDRRGSSNNRGTYGLPSFTDQYFLFRFQGETLDYGWLEASMTVTSASGASAAYGPNLTIIQYGFDNTGAVIAAGAGQSSAAEPSTLAETGLAALILGAEGLRRWRKARKTA